MRAALLLSLLLCGCATCREKPMVCAVAVGAVVATGIVIANNHGKTTQPPDEIRAWRTK